MGRQQRAMTKAEEADCARAYRETGDKRPLWRLVLDNEWIVHVWLRQRRHQVREPDREDALTLGLLELFAAAKSFDPSRDNRFSSYVFRSGGHRIMSHLGRQYDPTNSVQRRIERLRAGLGSDYSTDYVPSSGRSLAETLPSPPAAPRIDRATLSRALSGLTPIERRVLAARYGIAP